MAAVSRPRLKRQQMLLLIQQRRVLNSVLKLLGTLQHLLASQKGVALQLHHIGLSAASRICLLLLVKRVRLGSTRSAS